MRLGPQSEVAVSARAPCLTEAILLFVVSRKCWTDEMMASRSMAAPQSVRESEIRTTRFHSSLGFWKWTSRHRVRSEARKSLRHCAVCSSERDARHISTRRPAHLHEKTGKVLSHAMALVKLLEMRPEHPLGQGVEVFAFSRVQSAAHHNEVPFATRNSQDDYSLSGPQSVS
jgi:hypothetical protein